MTTFTIANRLEFIHMKMSGPLFNVMDERKGLAVTVFIYFIF